MDIFFDLLHVFALRLIHAAYLTITAVQATARLISRSRVRRPPLHAAAHVGIVLDGGDSADVQRLAALISWLAAARVSFVTVCMAECDGSSYLTGSGSGKRLLSAMDGIGLRDVSVIGPGELPIAAHSSDNGDSRPAVSRAAAAGSSAGSHHVSSCENDDGRCAPSMWIARSSSTPECSSAMVGERAISERRPPEGVALAGVWRPSSGDHL